MSRPSLYVPEEILGIKILMVQLPKRHDRCVLAACCDCGKERWVQLGTIKRGGSRRCITCNDVLKSKNGPPRLSDGEKVGVFIIIKALRRNAGGWYYLAKDTRCGHEAEVIDIPKSPFRGKESQCGCPVRQISASTRYASWRWYLSDGQCVVVQEHRIIMEQMLGRELFTDENVHHINGVRDDNRPENLELWSTSQPQGQRVGDKILWAVEMLARYSQPGSRLERIVREDLVRELLGGVL